jgi:hypothetical protein
MAEESKAGDKKKVHPAAIVGPVVAIGASVFTVFIATGKDKTPEAPPRPVVSAEQPANSDASLAQPAQFGQADPATPVPATPPSPDDAKAVSPDGSSVSFSDESLTFSAAIPPGPANDPVLAYLRKDAVSYLASKKADSRNAYDALKKEGNLPPAHAWEVMIRWTYTAKAGDIVSLFGTSYEFTGGAHGMTFFDTHIARTNGQQLKVADMLKGGLTPAVVIAMCEALKVEKKKRIDAATIYDEPITCAGPNGNVKTDSARLVLAPSNQPGKLGGVYAYYQAYDVGAYAEGSYALTIQQEVFAEDLRPEFKTLFAGTAPPPPEDN